MQRRVEDDRQLSFSMMSQIITNRFMPPSIDANGSSKPP
jgi:hypothetical protein